MSSPLRLWPRRLHAALLQALLPSACALCGARCAGAVCSPCHEQFVGQSVARCVQCANPLPQAGLRCGRCLAHEPAFDATLAAAEYAMPLDQLVLQLKFGGKLALATWCAQMLRDAVLERPDFVLPDVLCPVPLGPGRLAERGLNQALEIARPLAKALGVPLLPRLAARVVETRAQSGLAPGERHANVAQAFVVLPDQAPLVLERHIGVVDDVMSSGQTLNTLAATLKRFGAARVTNLVFARTPPH